MSCFLIVKVHCAQLRVRAVRKKSFFPSLAVVSPGNFQISVFSPSPGLCLSSPVYLMWQQAEGTLNE